MRAPLGDAFSRLAVRVSMPMLLMLAGCANLLVADAGGMRFDTWQEDAVSDTLFDTGERLHQVAYRLKLGGVRWCEQFVHHEAGIVYWSDAASTQLGGAAGTTRLPRSTCPTVLFVAPDSAAGLAGVRSGDIIEFIDEVEVAGGSQGSQQLAAWAQSLATSSKATTLLLRRRDEQVIATFVPDLVCDFGVVLRNQRHFRVSPAPERRIEVSVGTVGTLDDDLLAFALAHVMSHGVLQHREKSSSAQSAAAMADVPFFVVGFALAIASMGAYPQAAAMPFTTLNDARLRKSLEPEADLWGLAMMAAAGFEVGKADRMPLFDDFSSSNEQAADSQARRERLEQAAKLIAEWQLSGQPLVPDPEVLNALLHEVPAQPAQ